MSITLEDQIKCVKREIGMRKRVYPRWVTVGSMKQESADKELERMGAVLATLEQLQAVQNPQLELGAPALLTKVEIDTFYGWHAKQLPEAQRDGFRQICDQAIRTAPP